MDKEEFDELCLGAACEVEDKMGGPDVKKLCPSRKCCKSKNILVTLETRSWEEKKGNEREDEDERWRQLFPDIKKCAIVIVRPRPEELKMWGLKKRSWDHRAWSHDPGPEWDWMHPLEQQNFNGTKRFVKKVEVQVQPGHAPDDEPRRPRSRLSLKHCSDVPFDSAHFLPQSNNNDDSFIKDHSKMDHSYCVFKKIPNTVDDNSQSQDARVLSCGGCQARDCCCDTAEKTTPLPNVFKKGHQWVLGSTKIEEEEEEEGEVKEMMMMMEEEEQHQVKMRMRKRKTARSTKETTVQKLKRRQACGSCASCLRKDCGTCVNCLDMRKFGGPSTKRQKCVFRRCLVVSTRKYMKMGPLHSINCGEEKVTTATEPPRCHWKNPKKWRDESEDSEGKEEKPQSGKERWGGRRVKLKNNRLNGEEEENESMGHSQLRRRIWERRGEKEKKKRSMESKDWSEPKMEEEGEDKRKTWPPQFPLATGGRVSGLLNGTHVQLNLTLDGSHLSPSIVSDSALTCLPGLLPQDDSVLHVSTGITFIPPPLPRPAVQTLQLKEEEEAVEIDLYGRNRAAADLMEVEEVEEMEEGDELCSRVSEKGKFFEVEVELPASDSDEETPTTPSLMPSGLTEAVTANVNDDVTPSDSTHNPPEFISMSSGSFSLFGGGVSDDEGGLLGLLRGLRGTVLPAHWVAVLADGPVLQLLQCSRLSTMSDTIVHVLPDSSFYITVQNRMVPGTHRVYKEHTHRITHLSQLVSLLLHLECLIICCGSEVRSHTCQWEVWSPRCHLLVAPPFYTCLPCLLEEEKEEEDVHGGIATENGPS